jgi:uncharacterized protein YdhG (YjbR/CyaY superfamily)
MSKTPASIDAYLETIDGERRAALERLRGTIRAILPRAEECISYRIPAFRFDGEVVAGFQARAGGCSYYPFSGRTLRTLQAELAGYRGTLSALHFAPERPLPARLVRRLLETRIAETRARSEERGERAAKGAVKREQKGESKRAVKGAKGRTTRRARNGAR